MSRERLSKWERGVHTPNLEDVALLSEVLGIPIWELGLGESPEEGLSPVELMELARSFTTIGRLLKPWLDRLRAEGGDRKVFRRHEGAGVSERSRP